MADHICDVVIEKTESNLFEENETRSEALPSDDNRHASLKTDSPVQSWNYISLSEESVVIKLIRTRSLVDTYYVAQRYADPHNILSSDGMVGFSEDILTTYFDLDALISECGLTCNEMTLVTALMDGYTVRDLVEDEGGYKCSADVFTALDLAARKIVTRNNERWETSMELAHQRRCKKTIAERAWDRRGV